MPESTEICLRTTRSSIVRPVRSSSARRPSSAVPRLAEMKIGVDDETRQVDSPRRSSGSSQTVSVYLRLRPRLTRSKRVKRVQDETYKVIDESTLLTKFPSLEGTTNPANRSRSPDRTSRRFNFTAIFDVESSQSDIFDRAVKPMTLDFLACRSCTLMSYGTTNAGKSYTFHGTAQAPGIVPRAIEFVFSRVDCTLAPWYKPSKVIEVIGLDEAGRVQEASVRDSLLAARSVVTDRVVCEEAYGPLVNAMKDDLEVGGSGEAMHSVWLTFVEIYNDNVYDLLSEDEAQANKTTGLRLVKDKQGHAFVQGARSICATTGLEAYRIFVAGQSRLTVGTTSLNPQSSRSHSVFTMRLLKYQKERAPQEVEVSAMTFCDLAGTGRSRMSTGAGGELKETKNINTSLLVLGRCLKGISEGQTSRQNGDVVGPFRESKLTRLFERVLTGKENLAMIVNLDTSPDLHVETLSVLNFAAIAKKIVLQTGRDARGIADMTAAGTKVTELVERGRPASCSVVEASVDLEAPDKTDSLKVEEENVSLTREIAVLRETALNREYEIRTEMANLYGGMIKDLEANWSKRTEHAKSEQDDNLKWSAKQIENFYRERIDSLTNRKRRRTSGGDHKDDGKTLFEELESENAGITAKVVVLRETIKRLKDELEILSGDKNKCVFELGLVKDELRQVRQLINDERGENVVMKDDTKVIDDLRTLIDEKNEKLKSLHTKLSGPPIHLANTSILKTATTEELEEELRRRKEIDAKFSSLTFKKETGLTAASRKLVENSADEGSDSALISSCVNPPLDVSTSDLHSNFFDTIDKVFRSSDGDDSGIVASTNRMSSSTEYETEDKACQTNPDPEEGATDDRSNDLRLERVEQLKLDYTQLTADLFHETLQITEFSQKLENIQHVLGELKLVTTKNDEKIIDYQRQLATREKDLTILSEVKTQLESKLSDMSRQLENTTLTYERKIDDLHAELKLREESESVKAKSLEEHQKKSMTLKNELSAVQGQLKDTSSRCNTEHIPRIESLQRELIEKQLKVNELEVKLSQCERDASRLTELNERVADFAGTIDEHRTERDQLRRQLLERLESKSQLENKLKRLTSRVRELETEITVLRRDVGDIVRMNTENSDIAHELRREISVAASKLANARAEMARSEEERRKLERTSGHEIASLVARLADFEKKAALMTRMRDNEDARADELDRLKLLLHEKEREMCLFKKNRDKTIRRYEALIRKLQADVEIQCNRESSKLRLLYPKRVVSKDSVMSVESFRWRSTLVGSATRRKMARGPSLGHCRFRPSCYPTCSGCSMPVKRSSTEALLVMSSTSLVESLSSGSKVRPMRDDDDDYDDDDEEEEDVDQDECVQSEIIEKENRAGPEVIDVTDCRRQFGGSSRIATATFSVVSTSDESRSDFRRGPSRLDVRRTSGGTLIRLRRENRDA